MRVSLKALAPLSSLLALASCAATSAPMEPTSLARTTPLAAPAAAAVAAAPVSTAPAASPSPFVPSFTAEPAAAPQRGYYDYDRKPDGPTPPHQEGRYTRPVSGRATFHFGGRKLDDAFSPTEEPGVFGVGINSVGENRLGVEGGFQFGYDEETGAQVPGIGRADLELSQAEIYLGLRAELTDGPVRPYVGVGGTWINTETRVRNGGDTAREDSNDFGMYAQGGVEFDLTDTFFLGVNYRQTFDVNYEVDGTRFDGDYKQVTVSLGLSF
ncbi:MAG: outer membrane beta-barrel protein [Planctomycetota bacterium]